jgi:hypothetical protein
MNASGPESREPVENVYWPAGGAPSGKYVVFVHHFRPHGDRDPTAFKVRVKIGNNIRTFDGKVTFGSAPVKIHEFVRR